MRLVLPFPISTNHCWGTHGKRRFVTQEGMAFRSMVWSASRGQKQLSGPVKVDVELRAPDKRRRDLDNFAGKSLLDALTHAGVWSDDSQVVDLHAWWGPIEKPGFAIVEIEEAEKCG